MLQISPNFTSDEGQIRGSSPLSSEVRNRRSGGSNNSCCGNKFAMFATVKSWVIDEEYEEEKTRECYAAT